MRGALQSLVLTTLAVLFTPNGEAESWFAVSKGTWAPSVVEINKVKSTLRGHMEALAKEQNIVMPPWDKFTLQLAGWEKLGRKTIHIRGSCAFPQGRDPRRDYVVVIDGGPCFFYAEYDVATNSYVRAVFDDSA
jgi:hypothetical protein